MAIFIDLPAYRQCLADVLDDVRVRLDSVGFAGDATTYSKIAAFTTIIDFLLDEIAAATGFR